MKMTNKNKSAMNIIRIARCYSYKVLIVKVDDYKGYLLISNPFYRTPYASNLQSTFCTLKYLKKLSELNRL